MISSPLNAPFKTHLQNVTNREALVIELEDTDGRIGYGEADPFSSPWYSEETIRSCFAVLKDFLIPILFEHEGVHPSELDHIWQCIRGNRMAKSGLSQAVWDLHAKQNGIYLGRLFGPAQTSVEAGAVIAADDANKAIAQIERMKSECSYKRYKIKINRMHAVDLLTEIRMHFPDLVLQADANSDYTLSDTEQLCQLDQFDLQMLEQPLAYNDLTDHAALQKLIKTPICLDESICSYQDAASAIKLGSGRIMALKMARVGGWSEALRIRDLCVAHHIPLWCGGMVEFGIAKAHNIALSSVSGFTLPGDLSPSTHYWERDIVAPEITVRNGEIRLPDSPGIGFEIDRDTLCDLTQYTEKFAR
nr:o-succinylbenzoate synthase [Sporolactobacillus mangiferae]